MPNIKTAFNRDYRARNLRRKRFTGLRHLHVLRPTDIMPRLSLRQPVHRLMQSKAATVEAYLAELPAERRQAIQEVRQVILDNLDPGYREGMLYGMIGYFVPHERYPAGYHCDPKQPLCFVGLASQKNHMALYMMCQYVYGTGEKSFRAAWARTGKKLDMGKSCIRFKRVDDLPLDLIGQAIRETPVDKHVEFYESVFQARDEKRAAKRQAATNKASKQAPTAKRAAKKSAAKKRAAR